MSARSITDRLGGLAFGGDYNPEQWDEPVWKEDDELMRRARVNLATLGVFSWALLEPEEGRYDFAWLDAHIDRLHANGVTVDLATPTASPPPWFTLAHPDALAVRPDGTRLVHGSRDTYCLAAPAYRDAARRMASALAARYGDHPALALWHVHNEYGTLCYCEHTAAAFRVWLRARHGSLDALNEAWGTAFWSQRYTSWEQVLPPRATQWHKNPGQALDFHRFWSDEIIAAYCEQRDAIRAHSDRPVTTNLMLPAYQNVDLWVFARELDVVTCDQYPGAPGLAAAADERLHARLGGYPAAPLRAALGIRVEEYRPLRQDERITLSDGSYGTVWSESLRAEGAETLATYTHGMLTGSPVLTRHRFGAGQGWYLSTRLEDADYAALVGRLLKEAGVEPDVPGLPPGVEAVIRHAADGRRWQVLLNHTPETVPLPAPAHDLLTDAVAHELPPGGCAVLRGH
ncbi:beta-galactosidase [Streptomyces sp. CA-210063]|uniref:beta-galactosidase n=1 Tax=Streptomyces sp. CA-210063 TaxID=2801029 RepID=UPI00214BE635|nr:beta-galactosidase [Streptomyces sp. CA-210063]UUU28595.1 beta-galactosidase [Streptomyces sp. CA-210063]